MGKSEFLFRYRVRSWPEYNRALVGRGSLTLWVEEQAVQAWRDAGGSGTCGARRRSYADSAIECALVVKAVFHLGLRATQGFLLDHVKAREHHKRGPHAPPVLLASSSTSSTLNSKL